MDIDIDSANRETILQLIKNTPASIRRNNNLIKHNTGVYVTDIPHDPESKLCTIDHETAENLGYVKIDFLNVYLYEKIKDYDHLQKLLHIEPDWNLLKSKLFVSKLIHIHDHWNTIKKMPEPIDSIPRLAMFLSIIRPAKKHLIGLPWKTVGETVWQKPSDGSYYFKKSHSIAYAALVAIDMNLNSGI